MIHTVIHKVVKPVMSSTWGGRKFAVYCKIKYADGRLSISGVEGPLPSGNCLGACGQIVDHLFKGYRLGKGWTVPMLADFQAVWRRWHHNAMQSRCEHQRELGWTYGQHHNSATYEGDACPVCGYRIGSAWLREEVPAYVLEFLQNLPDADTRPAWV